MKKGGVALLLISVLLFSIISVNFVSAGLLGDVWNKITGAQVEEGNVTEECSSVAISMWCPDETTLCPMTTDEQGCSVWDCDACGPEPPGPPPFEPQCVTGETKPYICEDETEVSWCECENENWVCKISVEDDCPDVGPEPDTCAAKIEIAFNKDVYKIGDPVKIIIEIFDSEGNHLPNYAFYAQMYDDRWHTPDLQKTDDEGYFIHTGTAEKPAGGVTEIRFRVYTKETNSCGSVTDTAQVKFEVGVCGIGGCVPEPECKDKIRMCGGACPPCPEDDENGEIFYPCSGCELEKKCYPYGYRKGGNYCSDENDVFTVQSEDNEQCENNFECKTNLCINGNCVSSNVWNKFLEWFKKLFGGDEEPEDCSKLLIEKDIGDYEYNQTLYGPGDAQVPIYSEDGEQKEIVKCCAAQYQSQDGKEGMGVVCLLKDKEEVENSIKWLLAKNTNLVLGEYKGERVLNDNDKVVAWTSNNYIVATGAKGEGTLLVDEDVPSAYLKRYPNDLNLTEDDIPYIPDTPDVDPKPFVFCTEEDKTAAKECDNRGGAPQSDPNTFEGTLESKEKCHLHGEGCCEVYTGCIMPDEDCEEINIVSRDECYWHVAMLNKDVELCEEIIDSYYKDRCLRDAITTTQDSSVCEKIDSSEYRDKCYINVAEHTGDAGICDKIDDSSLREKCYFWVAGQEGDAGVCEEMADSSLQAMCYVEVAEKTGDASFCKKIIEIHIRDKCYRDVAIAINDASLCEKITDDDSSPDSKEECYAGTD